MWFQKTIKIQPKKKGCHLITQEVLSQLPNINSFKIGLCHLFLLHTSAGLSINENYDSDVRQDMNTVLERIVPENKGYRHSMEGPDDMPAHVKSSLMGVSITIPITKGQLALGTWQGIWLIEGRNSGGSREIIATLQGQE